MNEKIEVEKIFKSFNSTIKIQFQEKIQILRIDNTK